MKHGEKVRRCREEIALDPRRPSKEIARKIGCSPGLVREVGSRMGVSVGSGRGVMAFLAYANLKWLQAQAEASGVTVFEIVNAIVTDARLEDQP